MMIYHKDIKKKDIGQGIIWQYLGTGSRMGVFHWNMPDKSVVPLHSHPEEQFGYVIEGGFEILLENEKFTIGKGDAYFIPPNALHSFIAIGETEAIDVFNPIKKDLPGPKD
jgi:quercetin dioxygenase-like cupin family protein